MRQVWFENYGGDKTKLASYNDFGLILEDIKIGCPKTKKGIISENNETGSTIQTNDWYQVYTNQWGVKSWTTRTITMQFAGFFHPRDYGPSYKPYNNQKEALDDLCMWMTKYENYGYGDSVGGGDISTAYFQRRNGKRKIYIPMGYQDKVAASCPNIPWFVGTTDITNIWHDNGTIHIEITCECDPFRICGEAYGSTSASDFTITRSGLNGVMTKTPADVMNGKVSGTFAQKSYMPIDLYVRSGGSIPKVDIYGPNVRGVGDGKVLIKDYTPAEHKFYVPMTFAPDSDCTYCKIKGASGNTIVGWEVGLL